MAVGRQEEQSMENTKEKSAPACSSTNSNLPLARYQGWMGIDLLPGFSKDSRNGSTGDQKMKPDQTTRSLQDAIMMRSLRRYYTKASSNLLVRCRRLPVPSRNALAIRCLTSSTDGTSNSAERNKHNTKHLPFMADLEKSKAFLFSPTITYAEFETKWKLIDRLGSQDRPPWLGRALTYFAASWRNHVKQEQSEGNDKIDWMLPVRPATAYFVLDILLRQVSQQEKATKIVEDFVVKHPNINVYAQRLQVWSQSGLSNTQEKIDDILQEIEEKGVRYTRRMYAVLLRHFKDEPERIEHLRRQINASSMIPDTAMWAALASSYSRNQRVDDAIHIWKDRILESTVSDKEDDPKGKQMKLVQESAADLGDGLLQRLMRDPLLTRATLQQAQTLLKALQVNRIPMDDHVLYAMMRLYAHAGRFQKTRWLYNRLKYPEVAFPVLLKALNRGPIKAKGPVATKLLAEHMARTTQQQVVEVQTVTLVYIAWAKTKDVEEFEGGSGGEKALEIHNEHMKRRKDLSLVYYNSLLRCLAESASDKGAKSPPVNELLNELRENGLVPDETTFNMGIRALLKSGCEDDAENLLQAMVKSPTPPNVRTMNSILVVYANYGTLASAIHCESTLNNMNRCADDDGQEHIRANIVTYNIILHAWCKTDAPFSAKRLWTIYHRILYRGLEPNMVTYNTLIAYFTRTIEGDDLVRAEKLLETLEEHPTLKPTRNHYYRIMKTWMDCEEYHKAEMILDRRIAAYISGKNDKVAPVGSNFHHLAAEYMAEGEIVEATEFLKNMIRICEKHKLPHHPEIRTYRILYEYWLGIEHPLRDQYEEELEQLMLTRFPKTFRAR